MDGPRHRMECRSLDLPAPTVGSCSIGGVFISRHWLEFGPKAGS